MKKPRKIHPPRPPKPPDYPQNPRTPRLPGKNDGCVLIGDGTILINNGNGL